MFAGPVKIAAAAAAAAFVGANLLSYRTSAAPPSAIQSLSSAAWSSVAPQRGDSQPPVLHAVSYGRVALAPDRLGQYHANVEIDGRRLVMLVDTGATLVALTYADAAAVGFRPMPSDFKLGMATANGLAAAAPVRLHEIRLDTIDVGDVPAIVMPQGAMATSLLGMSFLKKLRGFEIVDGNLVLRP